MEKNAASAEVTAFEADRSKTVNDGIAGPDSDPFLSVDALWALSS